MWEELWVLEERKAASVETENDQPTHHNPPVPPPLPGHGLLVLLPPAAHYLRCYGGLVLLRAAHLVPPLVPHRWDEWSL